MKYFILSTLFFFCSFAFSQFTDDFSDNDFTTSPIWTGDDVLFTATTGTLNSQSPGASTYYLSTPSTIATDVEWTFYIDLQLSTSGANFVDVYLMSDVADLNFAANGYFLRFGSTTDDISLYGLIAGVETLLIDGVDALINSSTSNPFNIKVTRTVSNDWELSYDDGATGSFTSAGTINESSVTSSSFFGILIEQSTAAGAVNSHFFDDFIVQTIPVDLTPPALLSATVINPNLVDILFDEEVDPVTAENVNNYDLQPFMSVSTATVDAANPSLVHIVPTLPFQNGSSYTLFALNIEDLAGNSLASQQTNFTYLIAETPSYGDIVINEFLCDPSPVVGLKEVEFVEIHNKSTKVFNVQDWRLGDASSDGTIQDGWLLPGEYMVLTSTSNVDSFSVATSVTSFPSLNNSGDNIVIRDNNGITLDSITYTDEWYQNPAKEGGGYTIERINPNDPCTDITDWKASNDVLGGTPGLINSVFDITPDTQLPEISQLIAFTPDFLEIHFTEGMDSSSLANITISTSPALSIQNNYVFGSFPSVMTLQFNEDLIPSLDYTIELQNAADCWLNSNNMNGTFALPELPADGDIVINEILFNPLSGGSDWVELYNNSDKLIDLKNWEIASFSNDTISGNKLIENHYLLKSGEFVILAEDTLQILQNYPAYIAGNAIQMDIPSYSNDDGTVIIIFQNSVHDEVSYLADWHFSLLDDEDGKSLERIDPNAESNDKNNWHTAAEAIGFATPGGENSQLNTLVTNGTFSFSSETISPDNDGFEDVLKINYEMSEPGLVGHFSIYDDRGRKVIDVITSELLGISGSFVWDGVRTDNTKASIGIYVGVFEVFNLDGSIFYTDKKALVVAGML
ncbi:MAG: lamin tail domain-containing protein [Flavobacteriales bacterium]|nr:lamin tail domain-containing protein [Flavobacteriales bacterium]